MNLGILNLIVYTIIFLVFASVVIAKAYHDFHQFKLREVEDKKSQFWVHLLGGYLVAMNLFLLSVSIMGFQHILEALKLWGLLLGFYFLVFDMILNWVRGKGLLYVGKTDLIDKGFQEIAKLVNIPVEHCAILIKGIILSFLIWLL